MEDDGVAEYQQAITDLNETFKVGVRAFAKYFVTEWLIDRKGWENSYSEPWPGDEYMKGFNAGVEAAESACDSFLGDYHS